MPAKLLNFFDRNVPKSAGAKSLLRNVATKALPPSLQSPTQGPKPLEDMDLLKRHHISLNRHSKHKGEKAISASTFTPLPATIDVIAESPPLVSFNAEAESSGALFSGQFRVFVAGKTTVFKSLEVKLICVTSVKKPVVKDCEECHSHTEVLKTWNFAKGKLVSLNQGEHKFPVSFLFDGKMPATTKSHLLMLDYHWVCHAVTAEDTSIYFDQALNLARAIHPGQDKNSVRIFPPTDITANVTYNPVFYETGEFPIIMKLVGCSRKTDKSIVRWRLRRLVWRIEEDEKTISHPCSKHAGKVPDGGSGISNTWNRTIGEEEVNYTKNPWKTDIQNGEIYAEFNCKIGNKLKTPVSYDVAANTEPYGININHHLIIELVVVEETATIKKPTQSVPTGSARILRAQFPLILTTRAGLGISWDEETPPVYQDVPPSPPSYRNDKTDCDPFEELDELPEDIEAFTLDESIQQIERLEGTIPPGRNSSRDRQSRPNPAHRLSRTGMSPRLVAQAMSPRLQAQAARDRSGQRGSHPSPGMRPSSSGGSRPAVVRTTSLSNDDLLLEPPEYRLNPTEEEEEESRPDVQTGSSS